MKKASIITLLLLLLLTLAVAVGCVDGGDNPAGSDGETVDTAETVPETEAETTLADIPAADALDQLMSGMESESDGDETMENGKIDIDMNMDMTMSMDGMLNTTSMPIKVTIVMDGDDFYLDGNILGSTSAMTYKDGILYLSLTEYDVDTKYQCAMTPEEFAAVVPTLFGTGNDVDADDLTVPELPALEGTRTSDLFASVTSELDGTNGDLIITCKGFNETLASDLAPLLQPMLEGLGLVGGGEWDENGELVTDPAATLAEVVGILRGLNEETMRVTFIFDKEGTLLSTSVDVTLTVEDGGNNVTFGIKGSFAVKEGGQTVSIPADADSYVEEDWRVVFDMETAEMLDLVPDGENCVTLSNDPAVRERQILYVYNHYEDFINNGVLFHLDGYVIESYVVDEETATRPVDIGALEGYVSLRNPATEEEDYTTIMTFQIPLSMKGEGYPADGTFVQVRYAKLELVEDSFWGSYMYILMADYTA